MNIKVPKEIIEFMDAHGSSVVDGELGVYQYLPFWIREVDGKHELVSPEKLPNRIKEIIRAMRGQQEDKQIALSNRLMPIHNKLVSLVNLGYVELSLALETQAIIDELRGL